MKTPDEIKNGLESCSASECNGDHVECPYITSTTCISDMANDALAYIKQLEQRLASVGKTCPEWISVEDRLPEGVVLVGNFAPGTEGYKKMDVADAFDIGDSDRKYFLFDGFEVGYDVTHWMPLPEPPKEDRPMHMNEYQALAQRTSNTASRSDKLENALLGLSGEVGELCDHYKKYMHQGHDLDYNHMAEEAGDVLWYLAEIADALGMTLEDIARRNIDKLRNRYPDGFDPERSRNREE